MSLLRGFLRSDRRILVTLAATLLLAPTLVALAIGPQQEASATVAPARAIDPGLDSDEDGLADLDEARRWGTDPARADTDLDGLDDAWETRWSRAAEGTTRSCPDPLRADAQRDCIGKGVKLVDDRAAGTDPTVHDSDADGIDDATELRLGMDPLRDDADADPFENGLTNRERAALGARADRYDTACSGMSDAQKARAGLAVARASTGGSGVPDGWALHFGLDPTDPLIGARRLDGDPTGMSVLEKAAYSARVLDLCARAGQTPPFARGLDPRRNDTDGDGLPDAWEALHERDPLDGASAGADPDGDGLTDLEEFRLEACPSSPDCDGDGLGDAAEARVGWNVSVDGETRRVFSHPGRAVSDGDAIPDGAKRDGRWVAGDRTFTFAPLDPATPDTDADDLADAAEILRFAGALRPDEKDTDRDGLTDGAEVAYWDGRGAELCAACDADGDGLVNAADPDSDGDGLTDGDELRPRPHPIEPGSASRAAFPASDPAKEDSDADGLPDAWEKRHARFDPSGEWDLDPARAGDEAADPDDDMMTNAKELASGTDPHDADSDDDGLPDGWEDRFGAASGARAGSVLAGRGFEWLLEAGEAIALSPLDDADAAEVVARHAYVRFEDGVRIDRTIEWTYADLYALGVSPTKPASQADGIPDLYKSLWLDEMPGAFEIADADGDGRSNRDEYVAGTDPLARDTDGGGLDDLAEADARLDPLEPGDDAGEGDLDGDGLSNAAELATWRTRVDSPDTDADGLLDGGDIVAPVGSALASRFAVLGIAHRAEEGGLRFLGEARVSTDPAAGCARAWSCAGDGLPDAWKAYYDIAPGSYHPPTESRSADGLGIALEYAWGRPVWWNESQHGPWWLGLDPTRADTNRDGIRDDLHTRVDDVADLDRDGLNDLSGEDATPFFGALDLTDRREVFASLQARGVGAPALAGPSASLSLASPLPASVDKGATFRIAGTLSPAAGGVPVLARLVVGETGNARTSDARLVHGAALTAPDGSFVLDVALGKTHAIELASNATVFASATRERLVWESDTTRIVVGATHRLVVWSHAIPGTTGRAHVVPEATIRVGSAAHLAIEGARSAAPGANVEVNVTLEDGAGDARTIAQASAISLLWNGAPQAPTRVEGSRATFLLAIPRDARPAAIVARATYEGDEALRGGSASFEVWPQLGTRLALEVPTHNATLGGRVELRGSLVDERGDAVPRANVTVKLAGATAIAATDASGAFRTDLVIPPNAALGSRAPTASFEGGPHHAASTASAGAVGVRASPTIVEAVANATLGRIEVRGKLLAAGAPVVDPTLRSPPRVSVEVAGLERVVTPASDGSFRVVLTGPALARPAAHLVRIASEATALVDGATVSIPIVLVGDALLRLEPSRGARGGDALLRGSLHDASGAPIVHAEIAIRAGPTGLVARTDANGAFVGRASLPASLPLGAIPATASFAGTEVHRTAGAASQLVVLARTSMIASRSVLDATDAIVELRFVDDAGAPRAGELVAWSIDGRAMAAQLTDAAGAIRVALPPATLAAPSVLLRARIDEGAAHAAFETAERIFLEQPTRLEIVEPPGEVAPGERLTLKVRVTTAHGSAVPDALVALALHGEPLGSGATVGAIATIAAAIPPQATRGLARIEASFAGFDSFLPSTLEIPLRIRSPIGIEATSSGGHLSILARGPEGDALIGAPLVVEAGDAAFLVTTDAHGRAIANVPPGEVVVRFLGDDARSPTLARATSTSAPPAPSERSPLAFRATIVAFALLALSLMAIGAFLFLRYRRRAVDDVGAALTEAERAFRARDEHDAMVLLAYRALVAALARRGLAEPAATPRETQRALAASFRLPADKLEDVIEAFELARYGGSAIGRETALKAANAIGELRHALREDAA